MDKQELETRVISAQAGSRDALEELCRWFLENRIFFVCANRILRNWRYDVRDVLQECAIKIFSNLDSYDADQGDFTNWCYSIITNASIDQFRKRLKDGKRIQHIKNTKNLPHLNSEQHNQTEAKELKRIVNEAVSQAGLSQRQALIWQLYRAGHDIPYVAETALGNSGGPAKDIVSREIWKVKRKLSLYLWTNYPELADIYKKMEFLFSTGVCFIPELDKGNISDGLQREFESNKVKPPDKVIKPHSQKYLFWLMTSKDSPIYMARKERDKLNVYH